MTDAKSQSASFLRSVILACLACFSAFSLQLSFALPDEASWAQQGGADGPLGGLLIVLRESLQLQFPVSLLLFGAVFLIISFFLRVKPQHRFSGLSLALAVLFAIMSVLGRSLEAVPGTGGSYAPAKVVLFLLGFLVAVYPLLIVLEGLTRTALARHGGWVPKPQDGWYSFVFDRHAFLAPLVIILVCWLPYLIVLFPGTTDPLNTLNELLQYHGSPVVASEAVSQAAVGSAVSADSPLLHRMLLGLFVDFGALLGSQSFGLFLFVLLQTAVLSTALAATVAYQRRLGSPLILRMALLLGFALVPLFPGWALCVSQATLFAALTAWYVMFMVEAVRNPSAFLEKKWPLPAFFVLALLMPLVGESGIFMLLLSAPFLLFVRHAGARRAAVMGITAAVFFLVSALLLLPAAGVSVSSVKAPLPAAFQQSARCLAIHPTDVTPAETAAIGAVLDVSAAPSLYNAGLADPVAQTFKKDASGTAVTGYLGAWAQMGLRHPDTYALATLSNSYSYFYPGSYTSWTWTHVNRLGPGSQGDISELYRAAGVSFGQPEALEGPRNLVYESSRLFMLSPLSLPTNIGFAVWIVLFSCVLVLKQRKGAALAAFSPLLALMASFLVAPMNGDIRLALPLIATMPLLLTFALALLRQRRPQNERRRRKSANTPLKPQRPRRGWLVEAHTPSGGPGGLGGSGGGVSNGGAVTPSTATREGGRVPQYSEADHSYDSESAQAQDNDAARAGEGAEGSGTKAAESKPDITQRNTIRYS